MEEHHYKIQAVNPELADLISRVRVIHASTGGDVKSKTKKPDNSFGGKQVRMLQRLEKFQGVRGLCYFVLSDFPPDV